MRNAIVAFGSEAAYLAFLAIDVEAAPNSTSLNIANIRQAIDQVTSVGFLMIYVNGVYWNSITGNDTTNFAAIPLWEPNTKGITNDVSSPALTLPLTVSVDGEPPVSSTHYRSPLVI